MAGEKKYLITLLVTAKGRKIAVGELREVKGEVVKVTGATKTAAKATKTYGQEMAKLGKRALMVIPVWLVLRAVFMTVIRTIGDMVRANLDLEEGLARIETVTRGTAEEVKISMIGIKRTILDVAVKSRLSLKELTEAYYFLATAALTTEEATAAFGVVTDAMVGTMVTAKEMSRAVAGVYKTMGRYILEGASATEKFQHIADVLTFTFSTQDVEMKELLEGYTKLAPFVTGLEDSFLELVTMIGFLNTRMLRGGRTGRLLGRSILQITKNADKLAAIFKVTFDPDKPIRVLDVIRGIAEAMNVSGRMTAEQGEAIRRVFGTRGRAPVMLLLESLDELGESIFRAGESAEGFAARMKEIRMRTVTAQAARMKTVFAVLMDAFAGGVYKTGDLAGALEQVNDALVRSIPFIRDVGIGVGWVADEFVRLSLIMNRFAEIPIPDMRLMLGDPRAMRKTWEEAKAFRKDIKDLGLLERRTLEERMIEADKVFAQREEERAQDKALGKAKREGGKLRLDALKEEGDYIAHNVKLLKTMGAHEIDIARYKLKMVKEEAEAELSLYTDAQKRLKLEEAQRGVIEAQATHRKEMVDIFQRAELDFLRIAGASELQILEIRKKQYDASRRSLGDTEYGLKLDKLRVEQAKLLLKEKAREVETAKNLVVAYHKADRAERKRIARLMELLRMPAERIAVRFRIDRRDEALILKHLTLFTKKAQDLVRREIFRIHRRALPGEFPEVRLKEVTADILLPEEGIENYWEKWTRRGVVAVDYISARFAEGLGIARPYVTGLDRVEALHKAETLAIQKREEEVRYEEVLQKIQEAIKESGGITSEKLTELIREQSQTRQGIVEVLKGVEQANKETSKTIEDIF